MDILQTVATVGVGLAGYLVVAVIIYFFAILNSIDFTEKKDSKKGKKAK